MPHSNKKTAVYEATMYMKIVRVVVVVVYVLVYGRVNFWQEFYFMNLIFTVG